MEYFGKQHPQKLKGAGVSIFATFILSGNYFYSMNLYKIFGQTLELFKA